MTTEESGDKTEQENEWHALPGMIGDIINADPGAFVVCGGYIVEKYEDGDLRICHVLEVAGSEDEFSQPVQNTFELDEAVYNAMDIGFIEAPDGGWGSETETLPETIWGGYE